MARQVRKSYEERRRRRRARGHQRAWKLQRMAVDAAEEPAAASGRGRQAARADAPRGEADLERFMEVRALHRREVPSALGAVIAQLRARPQWLAWSPWWWWLYQRPRCIAAAFV